MDKISAMLKPKIPRILSNALLRSNAADHRRAKVSCTELRGIFPAIPTPLSDNGYIDYGALRANFQLWNKIPTKGYLALGSNGEYPLMTRDERVAFVSSTKQLSGDKIVIAGSGCESTQATIEMSQRMADAGADCVLVINPCYFKKQMTSSVLIKHFETVATHSYVPVILYNQPNSTGMDIPIDVITQMSTHPKCIGLKDSGSDVTRMSRIVNGTNPELFSVLCGSASVILASYMAGCTGAISSLANVLGDEVCELYAYCEKEDWENAAALQRRLLEPNTALGQYGVAGLKGCLDWIGSYGGPLRAPLEPLDDLDLAALKNTFHNNGFFADKGLPTASE